MEGGSDICSCKVWVKLRLYLQSSWVHYHFTFVGGNSSADIEGKCYNWVSGFSLYFLEESHCCSGSC